MYKTHKIVSILIILIILFAVAFLMAQVPHKEVIKNTPPVDDSVFQDPNMNARQLCFIWNTEAGDKAQLSMDLRADQVIGELNWLPAEKDKKTGIFRGTVSPVDKMSMSRTVHALWDVSAEGVTNKEELIIKFGEGTANIGFGEMKLGPDGVWVYADPEHLSYEPNLSDTDCGDEAMD